MQSGAPIAWGVHSAPPWPIIRRPIDPCQPWQIGRRGRTRAFLTRIEVGTNIGAGQIRGEPL